MEVQGIKAALENGEFTEDLLFSSVHATASAFTMWLRELPSPLIPYYMQYPRYYYRYNNENFFLYFYIFFFDCEKFTLFGFQNNRRVTKDFLWSPSSSCQHDSLFSWIYQGIFL